jgi:hypothetical protein
MDIGKPPAPHLADGDAVERSFQLGGIERRAAFHDVETGNQFGG